jgi:pyrroline-5-carboxylate reductase
MPPSRYRLGFVGAGKLAGSVIRGLVRANFCPAVEILASEPNAEARRQLEDETGIATTADNAEVARSAGIIFVGVKPPMLLPVLAGMAADIEAKLVVSFAAGIRLADMEKTTAARLMRAMTNTPSAIGRAATGIAPGSRTTPEDLAHVLEIFRSIGVAKQIAESEIDAVTALAGSGPAFVYTMIEALAAGAVKAGLTEDAALQLAAQTAAGAAELVMTSDKSPEELRTMVVTPGGTTAAGLAEMARRGAADAIAAAVEAAAARGQEMAREFS